MILSAMGGGEDTGSEWRGKQARGARALTIARRLRACSPDGAPLTTLAPNPPAYPLAREEFRRALANGLGRAQIHVRRCGAAEVRGEILEAATVNQVVDPQVNGTRGEWLAELCHAAGVAESVVAQPAPEDPHDRGQRAALLLELARRGIAGAREALHACFGRAQPSADFHAAREIIELDGEAGLLFVVRGMGNLLAAGESFGVWGYELSIFDEQHEPGSGRALLEREAAADEHVRRSEERRVGKGGRARGRRA